MKGSRSRVVRPEALAYLACPRCGSDLELRGQRDPSAAVLTCTACSDAYPVEAGVPTLLPELAGSDPSAADHQPDTVRAFGAQWRMYEYGDTTWGLTVEERVRVVLHELAWTERDLAGKVILDAGCGNGTLSAALAERGATVVALDLSDSVFRAERHRSHSSLHFVQGNLFFPPLKPGIFDAIYSCGVFHHTPIARRCFNALVATLKDEREARYFVWLYSPRSRLFDWTVERAMKITRHLPDSLLVPLCVGLSPFVEVASRALTAAEHRRLRSPLAARPHHPAPRPPVPAVRVVPHVRRGTGLGEAGGVPGDPAHAL